MSTNNTTPPLRPSLPFDTRFIDTLGGVNTFMNDAEITEWIDSVTSPFLQDWYDHCLTKQENQYYLTQAIADPTRFAHEIMEESDRQHKQATQHGKLVYCPSHEALVARSSGPLDFKQSTALVACLVARYGIRGGAFEVCEDQGVWHKAAVMLMLSVIWDLAVGEHFARVFGQSERSVGGSGGGGFSSLEDATIAATPTRRSKGEDDIEALERRLHDLTVVGREGATALDAAQIEDIRQRIAFIQLAKR